MSAHAYRVAALLGCGPCLNSLRICTSQGVYEDPDLWGQERMSPLILTQSAQGGHHFADEETRFEGLRN